MNLKFLLAFLVGLSLACIYSAAPSAFARVAFGRSLQKRANPPAVAKSESKAAEVVTKLPAHANAKPSEVATQGTKSKKKI